MPAPGGAFFGGMPAPGGMGCLLWGVPALGGACSGGCLVWEVPGPGTVSGIPACTEPNPPVNRMTDRQV